MKKNIIFIVLVFVLTSLTFAQNCKWKINEEDPISEKKHLLTKKIQLKNGLTETLFIQEDVNNDEFYILPSLAFAGILPDNSINNCKLDIKLTNGELISVESNELFNTEFKGDWTVIDFKFKLDKETFKMISENSIKAIQIHYNSFKKLFLVKGKKAGKLKKQFECIFSELN